jgi:hypothetical protein
MRWSPYTTMIVCVIWELDRNDTFATLFGPTADKVDLYIGYRPRRSGRTTRINYTE